MAAPNMATITASIERSLQNCSLSSDTNNNTVAGAGVQPRFRGGRSTISESAQHNTTQHFADNTLELNSQIRLPYYWEQCLDLKVNYSIFIFQPFKNFNSNSSHPTSLPPFSTYFHIYWH